MSVRDYAILWVGATRFAGGSGGTALGGTVVTATPQHKLDGPEHLTADDTTDLDSSTAQHGLMPKLDGVHADVWRGDGSQEQLLASEANYDHTSSGLAATNVQQAIDELHSGVSTLDGLSDVAITAPVVGDRLRFDGAAWVNSRLTWVPVLVSDPTIVTTDGHAVYVPLTTTDGVAILVESAA